MKNTALGAKVGKSSPSKLAPETIKIRNALIEKYSEKPIEELNEFLQRALEVEKDELKRLGLLAARVYILRQRVLSLKTFIRDERLDSIPTPNLALTEQILLDETANSDIDAENGIGLTGEWHSLQMIEPGEVNGVRFFEGTVINTKSEDAKKLISSGKAIVIDETGNPVDGNNTNSPDDNGAISTIDFENDKTEDVIVDTNIDNDIVSDTRNVGELVSEDTSNNVDSKVDTDTLDSNTEKTEEVISDEVIDDDTTLSDKDIGAPKSKDILDSVEKEADKTEDTMIDTATDDDTESGIKNVAEANSEDISDKTIGKSANIDNADELEKTKT